MEDSAVGVFKEFGLTRIGFAQVQRTGKRIVKGEELESIEGVKWGLQRRLSKRIMEIQDKSRLLNGGKIKKNRGNGIDRFFADVTRNTSATSYVD